MGEWGRQYFQPGGGDALIFYVLYGQFGQVGPCSAQRYDTKDVPAGIEITHVGRVDNPPALEAWETGPFGDFLRQSGLDGAVKAAPEMLDIRGQVQDPASLEYLRDVVGVVTCLLDQGGVCVLDPHTLKWRTPAEWKTEIFERHAPVPRHHAVILHSAEEGDGQLEWYHTRGMRKFGRPDLSVHNVPAALVEPVIDLLNRFIEMEAFGAIIAEGQPIRMATLPEGLTCHHAGDMDDLEFNNVHVEVTGLWPTGSWGPPDYRS